MSSDLLEVTWPVETWMHPWWQCAGEGPDIKRGGRRGEQTQLGGEAQGIKSQVGCPLQEAAPVVQ